MYEDDGHDGRGRVWRLNSVAALDLISCGHLRDQYLQRNWEARDHHSVFSFAVSLTAVCINAVAEFAWCSVSWLIMIVRAIVCAHPGGSLSEAVGTTLVLLCGAPDICSVLANIMPLHRSSLPPRDSSHQAARDRAPILLAQVCPCNETPPIPCFSSPVLVCLSRVPIGRFRTRFSRVFSRSFPVG